MTGAGPDGNRCSGQDQKEDAGGYGTVEGRQVNAEAEISYLPPKAAKMIAIEVLLADPESLGDDVLESCLYILRERLRHAS